VSAEPGRAVPWGELKARLQARGFRPSRRLGQNFLIDENLTRAIVRDAGVGPGDFVLEVGPGLGFLTLPLLAAGAEVLAVEIDGRLLELLREIVGDEPRFRGLHGDCLGGKHELSAELCEGLPERGPWALVSNLPYSISAPLLALLAGLENPPRSMTVLVQAEVCERLCAHPGEPAWGPISAKLQGAYDVRRGRAVGAGLFWPRPRVESAVAHLERRAAAPGRDAWLRFSALVSALFAHRRQGLGRVWGAGLGDREGALEALSHLGIDPRTRAEDLALEDLWRLADHPRWKSAWKRP